MSHKIIPLGKISDLITSGSRGWAEYYSESGALFLRMTNLPKKGIQLLLHDNKYVSVPEGANEGKRTSVKTGDVLISITAELGKIGYVENTFIGEAYVNQHICLVRIKPKAANSKFIAYYLSAQKQRNLLNRFNDSSAKSGLNLSTINNFPISLPNIKTQNHIVDILSLWDKSLEKIQSLIAAKEQFYTHTLKQMMCRNQSITEISLAKITTVWKGQQLNKANMNDDGDYDVLNGGIGPSGKTTDWNCEGNTISISNGGNSCGFVNLNAKRFWCGGDRFALKELSSQVNVYFLFHQLKAIQHRVMLLRSGSGIPHIYRSDIERLQITLPPLSEQVHIANYLNCLRDEIQLLQKLLNKCHLQKISLMQKLLTGEWFLKNQEKK